jgi:ribosome-binding factor A
MAERRQARVGQLIQSELARLLVEEARDAALRAVTISAVRVSADLRVAHIYVRSLAAIPKAEETLAALERAATFLRREVGRMLGLRVTPELRFSYDELPDTARRIAELLGTVPGDAEGSE